MCSILFLNSPNCFFPIVKGTFFLSNFPKIDFFYPALSGLEMNNEKKRVRNEIIIGVFRRISG